MASPPPDAALSPTASGSGRASLSSPTATGGRASISSPGGARLRGESATLGGKRGPAAPAPGFNPHHAFVTRSDDGLTWTVPPTLLVPFEAVDPDSSQNATQQAACAAVASAAAQRVMCRCA